MRVDLLPGADAANAIDVLDARADALSSLWGEDVQALYVNYLRWANDTVDELGACINPRDVDRIVLTPRHWTLQALIPGQHLGLKSLLNLEIHEVQRRLATVIDDLKRVYAQWQHTPGVLVVPDTNVFLHHHDQFDQVDWAAAVQARPHVQVNLVLPMVVLDELDRHKRTGNRNRARATLRIITSLFTEPLGAATLTPATGGAGRVVVHLMLDDPRHVRLPHPDSELVDRAQSLGSLTSRQVTIVTFDTGMVLRARAANLGVRHLSENEESGT